MPWPTSRTTSGARRARADEIASSLGPLLEQAEQRDGLLADLAQHHLAGHASATRSLRVRPEDVRLVRARPQVHACLACRRVPCLAAGDELDLLARDLGDAEDVCVRADLLDHLDPGGNPWPASSSDSGRSPSTIRSQPADAAAAGSGTVSPPNGIEPFALHGSSQRFIAVSR